jgi:hypothetical protein
MLAVIAVCAAVASLGVVVWRRRRDQGNFKLPARVTLIPTSTDTSPQTASAVEAEPKRQLRIVRRAATSASALGVVAATELRTCPSCAREFSGQRFCNQDARRLALAHELKTRGKGVICLGCKRAYDAGISKCPHDNLSLVPYSIHAADSLRPSKRPAERVGERQPNTHATICPLCGGRDDLHARFCGRDGAALLVIN